MRNKIFLVIAVVVFMVLFGLLISLYADECTVVVCNQTNDTVIVTIYMEDMYLFMDGFISDECKSMGKIEPGYYGVYIETNDWSDYDEFNLSEEFANNCRKAGEGQGDCLLIEVFKGEDI